MEKILNFFTQFDKDKLLHVLLTYGIALLAACIAKPFTSNPFSIVAAAWFAGFAAGLAKEIYDESKKTGSDSADWLADIIGTAVATIEVLILVI